MTTEIETRAATVVEETTTTMTGALRRGAEAGAQAAAELLPAMGRMLSRTVYGTCYYTAYGATFGALAIASLIPRDSLIEKAFHDGAMAAEEAFNEHESAIVGPSPEIPAAA